SGSAKVHPLDGTPRPDTISVVSLNMAKVSDPERAWRDIAAAPRLRNADVFLMQEVLNPEGGPSVADRIANRFGYHVSFAQAEPGIYDQGLAVISRFQISNSSTRRLRDNNVVFRV